MKFETFTRGNRTFYPVFLAGFHDSIAPSGVVFLRESDAEEYCKDKVVHVKPYLFRNQEDAESFVKSRARAEVNHCNSLGFDICRAVRSAQCEQFKQEVIKVINEQSK